MILTDRLFIIDLREFYDILTVDEILINKKECPVTAKSVAIRFESSAIS